jgi:hypothetical protein
MVEYISFIFFGGLGGHTFHGIFGVPQAKHFWWYVGKYTEFNALPQRFFFFGGGGGGGAKKTGGGDLGQFFENTGFCTQPVTGKKHNLVFWGSKCCNIYTFVTQPAAGGKFCKNGAI